MRRIVGFVLVAVLWSVSARAQQGFWGAEYFVTGPNARVNALESWEGTIVAGGAFDAIADIAIDRIAIRTGAHSWQQLGQSLPIDSALDFCVHDGALYVLVLDTHSGPGHVWRLDGEQWQPVGGEVDARVLASYHGDLYAGAHRLDGDAWTDVLAVDGIIFDMIVMDDLLVAGGAFTQAGGVSTGHVLAWDGAQVANAFPGQDGQVTALRAFHGELYAGRSFTDDLLYAVQVWQGGAWVDMPQFGYTGNHVTVTAMIVDAEHLLVSIREVAVIIKSWGYTYIYDWDGSSSTLIYGDTLYAKSFAAMLEDADGLYLGGDFTESGATACVNLGRWSGGAMLPICNVGQGCDGSVTSMNATADDLAIGGEFHAIGGLGITNVALRAHAGWLSCSTYGIPGRLIRHDGRLTVSLWDAFGPWSYLAYRDADHWESIWFDFDPPAYGDIASFAGQLVGVTFDRMDTIDVEDGGHATATPLVQLTSGSFSTLAALGDRLVVAGTFTEIGGVAASNIAWFDGLTWHAYGDGLPTTAHTIGSWQDHPVVWREGPESNTQVVSAWDGAAWQDLGLFAGSWGCALQDWHGNLYVGGNFTAVDGQPIANLACWTGVEWRSPGEIDGTVRALAAFEDVLWIGGSFAHAGGLPAAGLTTYALGDLPVEDVPASRLAVSAAPNPFNPRTTLHFTLPAEAAVTVDVYDVAGRKVDRLVSGACAAGDHAITWEGLDARGRALPSGTYLVRVKAGDAVAAARVSLVR